MVNQQYLKELLASAVGLGSNKLDENLMPHIPYIGFVDNMAFLDDGTIAFTLGLQPIYDDFLDHDQLLGIKQNLDNILNDLDQEVIVQIRMKKDRYFEDVLAAYAEQNQSGAPLVQALFQNRLQKLQQQIKNYELFRYTLYITVAKQFSYLEAVQLKSFFETPEELEGKYVSEISKAHREMQEYQQRFQTYLQVAGLCTKLLSRQEIIEYTASAINLQEVRDVQYFFPEDLVASCVFKTPYYFGMNNMYARVISIKNSAPPQTVFPTIIKALYNGDLRFEFDIQLALQKRNIEETIKSLEAKKGIAYAMRAGVAGDANEQFLIKHQKLSTLLTDIANGNTNIFDCELLVLVKAYSLDELNYNCNIAEGVFSQLGSAKAYLETYGNFSLFKTFWPGNNKLKNSRSFPFKTQVISDLIPLWGGPDNSGEPVSLVENRWRSLTYFNILSPRYPNKNGLILGATGQGKSFFMNLLAKDYLCLNPEIIFIEIGNSFEKFVKSLEGQYFQINDQVSINPFYVSSGEKRIFWQNVLEIMVRDSDQQKLSLDEKIIVEDTIERVAALEKPAVTIDDFVAVMEALEYENSNLREVQDSVLRHLQRWTKGTLGEFCNNLESSLQVDKTILGFNLKGIETIPELTEVFMAYISNLIWTKLERDPERIKLIIFDEVWKFFGTESGVELIRGLYRTIRKYHGALITISQDVGTYVQNPVLKDAIMENIGFSFILKQANTSDYERLQNIFGLVPREVELIQRMATKKGYFSEVFIKSPEKFGFIGRVTPDPFSYWLATTDPQDRSEFDKELARYEGDIIKTCNALAEKYPHGIFSAKE